MLTNHRAATLKLNTPVRRHSDSNEPSHSKYAFWSYLPGGAVFTPPLRRWHSQTESAGHHPKGKVCCESYGMDMQFAPRGAHCGTDERRIAERRYHPQTWPQTLSISSSLQLPRWRALWSQPLQGQPQC